MGIESTKQNWLQLLPIVTLAVIVCFIILIIDLNTPLGYAVGAVYSILILYSWIFPGNKAPVITGIICTILIIVGFVYSPVEDVSVMSAGINRIISILVIWICTALVGIAKKSFTSLSLSKEKLEQKIRERTQEIEARNKELEQFVYITSHDLQEPLRTIKSFVELFKRDYETTLDEKGLKYLSFVSDSSTRMSLLINGILDYSRLGRIKKLSLVDTQGIINDLKSDISSTYDLSHVTLRGENLPQIFAFEMEMRILLQNLVLNAIRFKHPDRDCEIEVTAERQVGFWQFCVSDNGIGIAEEHFKKIFLIFQRLHSRNVYEGAGIGLSHCQKVATLHGGTIWVASKINEGSKFFFTIPYAS